jgi:endonuclease/exonuclease/phosphatase family metal-dependent hydrolase
MSRPLTIAFWNVQNLFAASAHPERGPRSRQELGAKLDALARVIGRLADGGLPDLLAMAEVADEKLVRGLTRKLMPSIQRPPFLFEAPSANDTGIAVLALTPRIAALHRVDAETRGHRPRALSVKVTLATSSPPLYVIACHWKSDRFAPGQPSPQADRIASGRWLLSHLSGASLSLPNGKTDPVIVIGDLNAEPYAREISRELHATRHYAKSLGASGVRLLNCMWPWLVDPGASAVPGHPLNAGPRSLTSFGAGEPAVLDQLLVSRSVLRGDSFALESVDYHRDVDTARSLPRLRHVVPSAWTWDGTRGTGTSDHFPLVANLLY